jgi:uncharacterized phage protein (TIGR02218 family)
MTLATDERKIHDGQPRELYDFTVTGGDAAAYYYTDHHENIVELGNTYVSSPIRRNAIATADTDDIPSLQIRMPYDLGLVADIAFQDPPQGVAVEVRRYHGTIGNVSLIWKGVLESVRVQGREATLTVPALFRTVLQSRIPTISYQGLCNHVLYDDRCTLLETNFDESRTVDALTNSDRTIELNTLSLDTAKYVGGYIENAAGEKRLVVDGTNPDKLIVVRAFRDLSASDAVTVVRGCDHSLVTCNTDFSNLVNFGGSPFVQSTDVFRFGVDGSSS